MSNVGAKSSGNTSTAVCGAPANTNNNAVATAGTAAQGGRINNPFAEHSKYGRLPFIKNEKICKKVKIGAEAFDRRSKMYLREFCQNCPQPLRGLSYPVFLKNEKQFSVLIDGYRLHCSEILGYGRFGIVFKATIEGVGLQVAVKFMFNERPGITGYRSEEFKKARKLPQKLFDAGRIIYYLALCDMATYDNTQAELIIMELAENGDLFDSLVKSTDASQQPRVYCAHHARRLTSMVIEAMNTLRQNGFLHRDLKAENLLFNKQGQMVLGDIGNIKALEGGTSHREVYQRFNSSTNKMSLCVLNLFLFIFF